jgi:hypothetical protein
MLLVLALLGLADTIFGSRRRLAGRPKQPPTLST